MDKKFGITDLEVDINHRARARSGRSKKTSRQLAKVWPRVHRAQVVINYTPHRILLKIYINLLTECNLQNNFYQQTMHSQDVSLIRSLNYKTWMPHLVLQNPWMIVEKKDLPNQSLYGVLCGLEEILKHFSFTRKVMH